MDLGGARLECLKHTVRMACGTAAVALGVVVLIGWAADIDGLKSVVPGFATMKANTAACFVLIGVSLWAAGGRTTRHRAVGSASAGLVTLVALVTLAEYALPLDLGIDQLIFREPPGAVATSAPGRMALATALVLAWVGAAAALVHAGRAPLGAQLLAGLALAVSSLCCLTYLYELQALAIVHPFSSVAVHTAGGLLVVSLGLLAACPNVGVVGLLMSDGVAGVMARRLVPAAVLVPAVMGWLRLRGQQAGWYGTEFGLALFAISNVIVFTALVSWTATRIGRTEARRRLADQSLRESEAQFRTVVDASPTGLLMVDGDGRIVLLNATLETQFGYPASELIGRPVEVLIPRRYRAAHSGHVRSYFAQAQARAMGRGGGLWGLRKDGTEFPIEIGLQPVKRGAGLFVLASVIDISERRQAQLALQQSEERLRLLLEGVPQLIWTCRPDGGCDYLSRQWVEYTGVPEADQLGYGWADAVHPDDRPGLLERWGEAVRTGGPFDVEFRIRGGAGGYRWFKTRAVRFRRPDGTEKWFGTNTDIHDEKLAEERLRDLNATLEVRVDARTADLRASEERFRLAVEATGMGVWDTPFPFTAFGWDGRLKDIWGLPADAAVDFDTMLGLVHPDDRAEAVRVHTGAVDPGGSGGFRAEFRICPPGGGVRWVSAWGHTVFDGSSGVRRPTRSVGVVLDVTDRRAAADALRASEERFRAFMDHLPLAAWATDEGGRLAIVNRFLARMLARDPRELLGKTRFELLAPADARAHEAADRAVRVAGRAAELEEGYARPDGTWGHTVSVKFPFRGADGDTLIGGVALDITDRKRAEDAVRESRERLAVALENAGHGLWDWDVATGRVYLDDNWAAVHGYGPGELANEYATWERLVHPDDRPRVVDLLNRHLASSDVVYDEEYRARRKDGTWAWVNTRGRVQRRDAAGRPLRMLGTVHDVTARKRAETALREQEELFRNAFDHAPIGVALVAPDGRSLRVNRSVCDILGYTEAELLATDFQAITHPDDLGADLGDARRLLAGEVPAYQMEKRYFHKRGRVVHTLLSVSLVRDGDARPLYFISQIKDITQRKEAEGRVRASLREKEVMLKEIHHRVKNNLQIVSALLDLQSGHAADRGVVEMFQESRGRVRSMALIHERLYRSEDLARVDFAEYIRKLADELYRTYKVPDGEVVLDLDVDVPPLPIDTAVPCGLLLNELMSNCFKHAFAQAGAGRLRVSLLSAGGDANVLVVADDGPGFPPELDFRDAPSFGLQLVNTLVDQMGGEVELAGGPGTTVTVRFPTTR